MYNLSGAIGVTKLKRNINDRIKKVFVFADNHSRIEYCGKNFESTFNMKDLFIKEKYKSQLLLEEIKRKDDDKLKELWSNSEHTIALKNMYLENKDIIEPIDIRQYLYVFSWELLDETTEEISIKKYLINFHKLFNYQIVIPELEEKLKNLKFKSTGINKYFKSIKKEFNNIIKNFNLDETMKEHIDKYQTKYLIMIDEIASKIMDWYTIILIFNSYKKTILHAGLFHTNNIVNILVEEFDFEIYYQNGVNDINTNDNIDVDKSCIISSDE